MGDFVIKISKFLYIHFTVLFLFAVGYINRNLEILAVSYLAVFLHELAHLSAAILIGLKPSHIIIYAFGVNLKLKNSLVYSIADEILLYLSGPFMNIILALISLSFYNKSPYWKIFYYNNIGLFLFNLLPILPMDGGVVLKKILARRVGDASANKILKISSIIIIALLLLVEIWLVIISKFNLSIICVTIFLTGNLFTNKEKYYLDFTKELMFYKNKDKKPIKKVKTFLIKDNTSYKELIKNFSMGNYYVVFKENKNGIIDEVLTEREIIEQILK